MLKTCMGRLSFLYRNSSFLDSNCRKLLCSSLIQPYLDYCSSSWYSGVSAQLRSRMDVLQRKIPSNFTEPLQQDLIWRDDLRDLNNWWFDFCLISFFFFFFLNIFLCLLQKCIVLKCNRGATTYITRSALLKEH